MDIKKEREVFEKRASKFFKTNEAFEDDGENYVYDEVNFMWDCWLAAKAQAVPEGFVLAPKEPTEKMIDAGHDFCKNNIVTPSGFYKAMIEAQEPAND